MMDGWQKWEQDMEDNLADYHKTLDCLDALLRKHGFEMKIWGCGCCGSPQVIVRHGGESVVDHDDFIFNNLSDRQKPKTCRYCGASADKIEPRLDNSWWCTACESECK